MMIDKLVTKLQILETESNNENVVVYLGDGKYASIDSVILDDDGDIVIMPKLEGE